MQCIQSLTLRKQANALLHRKHCAPSATNRCHGKRVDQRLLTPRRRQTRGGMRYQPPRARNQAHSTQQASTRGLDSWAAWFALEKINHHYLLIILVSFAEHPGPMRGRLTYRLISIPARPCLGIRCSGQRWTFADFHVGCAPWEVVQSGSGQSRSDC